MSYSRAENMSSPLHMNSSILSLPTSVVRKFAETPEFIHSSTQKLSNEKSFTDELISMVFSGSLYLCIYYLI